MSNLNQMRSSKNNSVRIFGEAVTSLSQSNGFYCRIRDAVNSLDAVEFNDFCNNVAGEQFGDSLDVVMYLEG